MKQTIAILRMLTIAMIVGLICFVAISHWFIPPTAPSANVALFWAILGGLALSELAAYFLLRAAIVGGAQRRFQANPAEGGDSALPGLYFTVNIIGLALAESIGLFAAILLMLLGDTRLLIFVGAALAAMIALFPTENRYRTFVQNITGTWPTAG